MTRVYACHFFIMYFPDRGCVQTLLTLYVYATVDNTRRLMIGELAIDSFTRPATCLTTDRSNGEQLTTVSSQYVDNRPLRRPSGPDRLSLSTDRVARINCVIGRSQIRAGGNRLASSRCLLVQNCRNSLLAYLCARCMVKSVRSPSADVVHA